MKNLKSIIESKIYKDAQFVTGYNGSIENLMKEVQYNTTDKQSKVIIDGTYLKFKIHFELMK